MASNSPSKSPHPPRTCMQVRLSWDCSKSAPPPYPGARPLLEGRPSVGPPSPRASTFRPRGFSPPRRFAPRTDRGSIAPRTGHGVRHVSRFAAPDVQARLDLAPVPRDAVHTPRRIPLAGSRTASPRPLPPCRCRIRSVEQQAARHEQLVSQLPFRTRLDFEALLRLRVRSAHDRFRPSAPYPSMGLVPLRGPFPAAAAIAR
jgi:hypothetical protein